MDGYPNHSELYKVLKGTVVNRTSHSENGELLDGHQAGSPHLSQGKLFLKIWLENPKVSTIQRKKIKTLITRSLEGRGRVRIYTTVWNPPPLQKKNIITNSPTYVMYWLTSLLCPHPPLSLHQQHCRQSWGAKYHSIITYI